MRVRGGTRVRRIVFASSNHAVGMHSVDTKLDLDCDLRPDGFYGLSKVWGEAMTRMYWDKHGIEGISLRIGTAIEKPTEFRHLSTWLGNDDLVQLITAASSLPDIGYLACGAFRPTRAVTGTTRARRGSVTSRCRTPRTTSRKSCSSRIRSTRSHSAIQGGGFVTIDYTPPEQRPPRIGA